RIPGPDIWRRFHGRRIFDGRLCRRQSCGRGARRRQRDGQYPGFCSQQDNRGQRSRRLAQQNPADRRTVRRRPETGRTGNDRWVAGVQKLAGSTLGNAEYRRRSVGGYGRRWQGNPWRIGLLESDIRNYHRRSLWGIVFRQTLPARLPEGLSKLDPGRVCSRCERQITSSTGPANWAAEIREKLWAL